MQSRDFISALSILSNGACLPAMEEGASLLVRVEGRR
jgi:hypothetical protein